MTDIRKDVDAEERIQLSESIRGKVPDDEDVAALAEMTGRAESTVRRWFAGTEASQRAIVTKRMTTKPFDELSMEERRRLELARFISGGVEVASRFTSDEKKVPKPDLEHNLADVIRTIDGTITGADGVFMKQAVSAILVERRADGLYVVDTFYRRPNEDEGEEVESDPIAEDDPADEEDYPWQDGEEAVDDDESDF